MREPGEFWSRVDKSGGPEACWLWTGTESPQGYGQVSYRGRSTMTHRLAWRLTHGEIPPKMMVLHKPLICHNRLCCNPLHLYMGTRQDNSRDSIADETIARGERHAHAKLTELQVLDIRKQYSEGVSQTALARHYGVSCHNIGLIVHNKGWVHLVDSEKTDLGAGLTSPVSYDIL